MTRWMAGITIMAVLLLLPLRVGAGGLPVYDAISDIQAKFDAVQRTVEAARAYAQMVEQYKQQVEGVLQMVRMVEQGGKMLANMPQGMGVIDLMTQISGYTESVLSQAEVIGFGLNQSVAQFDALYGEVAQVRTPEGRAALLAKMQEARVQTSRVAIQAQAVQTSFSALYARLAALLGTATLTEGVKAMQQVTLHQQALAQQQQQIGLGLQAVSARLETMKDVEALAIQQMHNATAEHEATVWYGGPRLALPPTFTGFRIQPR